MSSSCWRSVVAGATCLVVVVGCAVVTQPGDGGGAAVEDDSRGFVDAGGFFTFGDAALPPLIADSTEETATESFFAARSIDPASEDSAGPKFVVAEDIDLDGLPDLATAWNQSQVVQVHLQRRDANDNVTFQGVQIAGNAPIAIIAGLEVADVDADGNPDLVVLVKHDATAPICPGNGTELDGGFVGVISILFSPGGDALQFGSNWEQVNLLASTFGNNLTPELVPDMPPMDFDVEAFLSTVDDNTPGLPVTEGGRAIDVPENGGMTALAVGDVTGNGMPDIVITSNVPEPPCHNGFNDVELYPNPGAGARNPFAWAATIIDRNAPPLKDLLLSDVDVDGDLDVITTRPNASSFRVSWLENPGGQPPIGPFFWVERPIGQVDTQADVMTLGDVDGDGLDDVVVRSNMGRVIQWFRHPGPDDVLNVQDATARIPWDVFTLFELSEREPLGMGIGDINFDGQVELIVGAEGSVLWMDSSTAAEVFDPWSSNLIVDDAQLENALFAAEGPAYINELLVFDLDCDGANDVVGTIDRRSQSGLSTDVVIWFRNTLLPEDVGIDEPLVPGCP